MYGFAVIGQAPVLHPTNLCQRNPSQASAKTGKIVEIGIIGRPRLKYTIPYMVYWYDDKIPFLCKYILKGLAGIRKIFCEVN